MKRSICALLAALVLLSLSACGRDAAAKAVDSMISGIGTVSTASGDAITAAEAAYSMLTDAQKTDVRKGGRLLLYRAYYNYLTAAEELNRAVEDCNSLAAAFNAIRPSLLDNAAVYSELASKAAELDKAGPAYDESARENVHSLISEAGAFFGSVASPLEMQSRYVPAKMFPGSVAGFNAKLKELSERKAEIEYKMQLAANLSAGKTEGDYYIEALRRSIEKLSESIADMQHIDRTINALAGIEQLSSPRPGAYENGHRGTVYFDIVPSMVGGSFSTEKTGAVEIYGTDVEAGISAEKLSAIGELIGPVFARGRYLIRFSPGVTVQDAQQIAELIYEAVK